MPKHVKIAIYTPKGSSVRSTFSIRLKQQLEKESSTCYLQTNIIFLNGSQGNFGDMETKLIRCGIMDEKFNWILGDSHAVITGNCLNGSKESVQLLWLIYSLETKAIKQGGYLHFLPGLSEITNSFGNWRSEQPIYAPRRSQSVHKYAILFDGNNELYRWLRTKNILERIGDITVVQTNLTKGIEDYLPKIRGRRFPEGVKEILQLPLAAIQEELLQFLHISLDAYNLMAIDAETGQVKLSFRENGNIIGDQLPLIYKNGKYHHLNFNTGKETSLAQGS